MAERIKGLQIDLSMRDMGVSKTLAGIKREFRSLNSSLKLSSNNFKYGEKSASSYKARMNDLDKAIKVGTSNLGELEKQYKQVAQSQGANSAKAVRLQTEYNKQANAINAMKDEYGRLNQYYRENFSMAGRLSNSFKSIGSSMQSVGGQAQNMGRSLTSSITKPALVAGTAMAGITAKLGFDRLVGLDSAKAKLEGLGYSTKEVGSITDQVSKAIEGGMTTMAEGTDVAAGALAAGVKEGKELEKYIKLVGDAAVGSNRPVSEMAMIFNRVQGQGKLMTQELNMVEEGMPGFSNAMAKHLGVSYDAFREMVTNGEVSSKEFLTVMDDFAGGMANAYSKSWKGMMQNTKAYIGMIGESLLGGVFEQSKDSLHEFEKMLKSPGAQQWAKETGEKLGSAFSKLANGIKGIINWWQSLDGSTQKTLGGMVKWLGIILVTMGPVLTISGKMISTIGGMFKGFSDLTKGIMKTTEWMKKHEVITKASKVAQSVWNGVTTAAKGIAEGYRYAVAKLTTSQTMQALKTKASAVAQGIWNGVTKIGRGIATAASGTMNGLAKAYQWLAVTQNSTTGKTKIATAATAIWTGVTKAATLAAKGLGLAFRFMTGPVGIIITVITALVGAIVYLWKTNSTFRNAVIGAWNAIKNAAIAVFGFIKPYIINIWNAIKNSTIAIWNGIKTSAVTIWNGIKFAVQHPIQALKNVLSALWNGMKTAAIKIWTLLKNGVLAIIRAYVAQVRSNFNLVKRIVLTIFNAIKAFSIKVWNAIKNGILNIVRILRNGIANIFKGIKNTVTTIFNAVKNFSIKVWNAIKNSVINRAKGLWNGVRNTFNALKKGTTAIFNAVKNFAVKVWTSIKNTVVSRAKALWSGVRNAWNNLKKGTTNIFKSVGSFMSSKWNSIKTGTVNKAKALWSGVKGAWGSLSKGTRNTMNAVGSFMSKKWKDIKSGTVDLVTGMKNKVTGVMNKMGDVIKSVTGKIGDFFGDMIKGVKTGLNKLIEGVNWVGGKLNMDKIDPIKLHTGTEHTNTTTNVVKNGKIARDTFATVGDKGRGNGPGGFRHEAIKYPNGKMALTPNRDTTAFLPKGSSVMSGAQTHSMLSGLPRFNRGTDKKKKDWDFAENALSSANAIRKDATKKIVSGGKAVVSKSLGMAAKGKKWLEDTVGDVMDWIKKPGKLLDKVLESVGLDLSGFGIPKGATLPYDMMKGMFSKLKSAAIDTIKGWMEEAEGGDGDAAWLLKHPVLQRFGHYTGGLMFNGGRHYGIDFGMPTGTKIRALTDGTITQAGAVSGGGGNQITLKEPGGKYFQWYMHLSKILAKKGQKVKTGDVLGLSGNTGNSTTPHLHIQRMKGRVGNDTALSNVMSWLKGLGGGGKKAPNKWRGTIRKAAKRMKVKLTKAEENGIVAQIARESNGDAGVTQGNIGDINNLRGTPAQGLLQYVPSTFKAYAVKGHKNIKSGYDQLLAFFNNKNWRKDLPYGKSGWGPSGGRRFATGGLINSAGWYNIAEGGHPEFVIPTDPSRQSDAMKLLAIASQRIEGNKKNKRPNQMRTPSTSNNNDNEMMNVMARQLEATQRQVELLTQLVASNQRLEQKPTGVSEQDMSKAQGKRAQMMAYNMGGAF
ncbi:phage tail tape measure protein [Staphylococcus ureilyticus]|uniref:peptidoglycan DD-metalloendopeptidase family protein n=1 Tax=Staphylococcus ureilyticus TaxID=94138 RepID=UPI0021576C55|nr:peptidoglycan DD-metalloendopeptidase family protein [Staphylococcus ureilyticus]MDV3051852.1 phage tail tape measure protein [Staphylococcus ureilyticus]